MIRSKGIKNLSVTSIEKIRRMIAAVVAEPEFYNQNVFVEENSTNICETVCCGAGWAVWCESPAKFKKMAMLDIDGGWPEWNNEALKALGLKLEGKDDDLIDETIKLFGYASDWPSPFDHQYNKAKTPAARAKVFAARWEKFISSDGIV